MRNSLSGGLIVGALTAVLGLAVPVATSGQENNYRSTAANATEKSDAPVSASESGAVTAATGSAHPNTLQHFYSVEDIPGVRSGFSWSWHNRNHGLITVGATQANTDLRIYGPAAAGREAGGEGNDDLRQPVEAGDGSDGFNCQWDDGAVNVGLSRNGRGIFARP